MYEILVFGEIQNDLDRLGIKARETYSNIPSNGDKKIRVYTLDEKNFEMLCEDAEIDDSDKNVWKDGAWFYAEGSNMHEPDVYVTVNSQKLLGWSLDYYDEKFDSITDYLYKTFDVSTIKNICSLSVDLAKYNDLSLSDLFSKFQ